MVGISFLSAVVEAATSADEEQGCIGGDKPLASRLKAISNFQDSFDLREVLRAKRESALINLAPVVAVENRHCNCSNLFNISGSEFISLVTDSFHPCQKFNIYKSEKA